jgi:hypothetical protein
MNRLDAAAFQNAMTILAQVIARAKHSPGQIQMTQMGENADVTRQMLSRLEATLVPMHLPVTKATIRDSYEYIAADTTYIGCGQILLNIQGTLAREFEVLQLFVLEPSRSGFYEPLEPLFGAEVHAKFPCIAVDVLDGGRAYACGLPTAAAFHWIRCLEAGARALARCLQIPDPSRGSERNWSRLKKSIQDAVEARWPASSGRMAGDGKLFDEVLGSLGAMANPYRNSTMHFDSSYSAGEALHIFELVRGVMQKIAARMDENGNPLA